MRYPTKEFRKVQLDGNVFLGDLKKLRYSKMVVRYDPKPALQAVVESAKNGFQGQLILEKIPV